MAVFAWRGRAMKLRNATEPFDGLIQRLAVYRVTNESGIDWPYEMADLSSISHQHMVKSRCPAIGTISKLPVAKLRKKTPAHCRAL